MPHGKICYLEIPANRAEDSAPMLTRPPNNPINPPVVPAEGGTEMAQDRGAA